MLRSAIPIHFALLAVLLVGPIAAAEQRSAQLTVSAICAPHVRSDVRGLPSELAIGEQDLARGFVELDAARLRVQTNDPAGYLVLFDLEGREIDGAEITGFDETVVVTQAGGFAHPPFAGTSTVDRTLRCRLRLSPTATAGVYRWPLKISVRQIGRRE